MFKSALPVVVLLVFFGCNSRVPFPTAPSPFNDLDDTPPLEALNTRHYLVDESGNNTRMWAVLNAITPLSKLKPGSRNCPDECLQFTVTLGIGPDPISNKLTGAMYELFLSDDKDANNSSPFSQPGILYGEISRQFNYGPWTMTTLPKYLVIKGVNRGATQWDTDSIGKTHFYLYHHR